MAGLRRRRVARARELGERERRVAQPERRASRSRSGSASSVPSAREAAHRVELHLRGTARAARGSRGRRSRAGSPRPASPADHRPLLEREHRVARACRAASRPSIASDALRVGDRMAAPVDDAERDALGRRDAAQELGTFGGRGADLEVRRARARSASRRRGARRAGRRARQHDRATTRRGGRSSGASRWSSTPASRSSCACASRRPRRGAGSASPWRRRAGGTFGSRTGRRAPAAVRTRAARRWRPEVEVDGDLAAPAEMDAARGVEERRELGEPVAGAAGGDRGELAAELVRERQPERPRARAGAA